MNKILWTLFVLSVLFVVGCQPAAQPAAPAPAAPAAPSAPEAQPAAPVEAAPAAPAEVPPAPLENTPAPVETGIDLSAVCFELLSAEEFKSICGNDGQIIVTPKITKGDCWVPVVDQSNTKLTGGFEVVNMHNVKDANREFDRGVTMRRTQGAVEGKEVGERSYQYAELGRHNIAWTKGEFLAHIGTMDALCPPDKLVALAQKMSAGLQ